MAKGTTKRPRASSTAESSSARDRRALPLRSTAREKLFLGFDVSIYDELMLLIFSWLSAHDLCVAQRVSQNWARLSQDQQLWKTLYMRTHGRERLRGSRGLYTTSRDGDTLSCNDQIPSQASLDKDWKYMFRVSSNWSTGRCVLDTLPLHDVHSSLSCSTPAKTAPSHVILADGLTFMASLHSSLNPEVVVHLNDAQRTSLLLAAPSHRSSSQECYITSMTVDQSQSRTKQGGDDSRLLRLAVFYSDSRFSIFSVPAAAPEAFAEVACYVPPTLPATTRHAVIQAAYNHPLLVTLSEDFMLAMFSVKEGRTTSVQRIQSLKSFTSFHPSSLVLSSRPLTGARAGNVAYKLTLSYAVPIYPSHWSVGVTDLSIVRRGADCSVEYAQSVKASSSRLPPTPAVPAAPRSRRRTSAPVTPMARSVEPEDAALPQTHSPPSLGYLEANNAELEHNRLQMALEREQWARKVARVVATETDGRWVVLAGEQDGAALQVYRLSSRAGRLVFVRQLFGHRGVVAALAVADGRCVSLGASGEVWAWDLETGVGVEVDGGVGDDNGKDDNVIDAVGPLTIAFDEMRVITSGKHGRLQVRRFDL